MFIHAFLVAMATIDIEAKRNEASILRHFLYRLFVEAVRVLVEAVKVTVEG
jgi:hypothetical protein